MQKIISKILLTSLMFSTVSMQGIELGSLWNKYSSTVLTSLYVLGASAIVYACHKDTPKRVECLKKERKALKQSTPELSAEGKQGLAAQRAEVNKMGKVMGLPKDFCAQAQSFSPEWQELREEPSIVARREHKQKLEDQKNKIAACYAKPGQLAMLFALIGGSIKLYNAYFK